MLNLALALAVLHLNIVKLLLLVLESQKVLQLRIVSLVLEHKLVSIDNPIIKVHVESMAFEQGLICSLRGRIGCQQVNFVLVSQSMEVFLVPKKHLEYFVGQLGVETHA